MSEPKVKVIANKQFWLNARDLLRGLLMAVISAVVTYVTSSLSDGGSFDAIKWKQILLVSAITSGTYLLKNFLTPANTTVEIKPPAKTNLEGEIVAPSQVQIDMKPGKKPVVTTSVG